MSPSQFFGIGNFLPYLTGLGLRPLPVEAATEGAGAAGAAAGAAGAAGATRATIASGASGATGAASLGFFALGPLGCLAERFFGGIVVFVVIHKYHKEQ